MFTVNNILYKLRSSEVVVHKAVARGFLYIATSTELHFTQSGGSRPMEKQCGFQFQRLKIDSCFLAMHRHLFLLENLKNS